MMIKTIANFDLGQIWQSGQCFRMTQVDETHFQVIAGDRFLEIEELGAGITSVTPGIDQAAPGSAPSEPNTDLETPNTAPAMPNASKRYKFSCIDQEFNAFWHAYFDLETDYAEQYIGGINPRDKYLTNAAAFGSGIRILRQDLWEMIVSFLISQQNNITRIRRCIQNICEKYGEERTAPGGQKYFAFPTPEALAILEDDDLKPCNLGYRSKYVVRAAKSVVSGEIDLDAIRQMNYKKAREELLKFFGVGEKVADCICLFALHHLQAFPIDTHINQALQAHYKRGFPNRRYHGFQGVMQQYIFYYELMGCPGENVENIANSIDAAGKI